METSSSHGEVGTVEMNHLFAEVARGTAALARLQGQYDADMWEIAEPPFADIRHIHIHLSITIGKIARLIEPRDHRVYRGETPDVTEMADELEPILADLLIHAGQIANLCQRDLGRMLRARYAQNAARFAPQSVFADAARDADH
jgi:hypothetical protein